CGTARPGAAGPPGEPEMVRHFELAPDGLAHAMVQRLLGPLGLEHLRSHAMAHARGAADRLASRQRAVLKGPFWRRQRGRATIGSKAKLPLETRPPAMNA